MGAGVHRAELRGARTAGRGTRHMQSAAEIVILCFPYNCTMDNLSLVHLIIGL